MSTAGPRAPSKLSIPPISGGNVVAGRFDIVGVLGEGGTGLVYDAVRIDDRRPVALKVMHAQFAGDKQIRGRFLREATILARLTGENLCPILESGETADPRRPGVTLLYMALPKLEGPSLERLIDTTGALPAGRAVEIMLEVCAALCAAHAKGVIHRDLKPANVIIEHERRAIVVDFGMAKIVAGSAGTTQLTQHNMIFGTPEYMAPEQARGDDVDERCDIYAAGIMLYELLTGHVPFSGPSALGVLTAHMTDAAVPPRERAPERDIPPALDALVMHAIAKSPKDRYASAALFAAALHLAREKPEDAEGVDPRRLNRRFVSDPNAGPVDVHGPTEPQLMTNFPELPVEITEGSRDGASIATAGDDARERRWWAIAWVVAAVMGICVGVALSLAMR